MEKLYKDYNYNLSLAKYWYKRIGKDRCAKRYHQAHLKIANKINQKFKDLYH